MKSSEFMAALPEAVQRYLQTDFTLQRGRVWPWGVQMYDDDPRYHYEVARLPVRMGERLELGLHFESRNPADNRALLAGFQAQLLELKHELGEGIEADLWDHGWTKVYLTMPLEPYSSDYLEAVARRLAEIVRVLHPVYRSLSH